MLNEQTFDKLYLMKLIGMAEGFREQLDQPSFRDLSFEERLGMLVEHQWMWKENKRLKRLLKEAKLKLQASIKDIDYRTPRGMEKSVILSLASCNWIRNLPFPCSSQLLFQRALLWPGKDVALKLPPQVPHDLWHRPSAPDDGIFSHPE